MSAPEPSREGAPGVEGGVISAGANAVRAWNFARGRAGHRRAASVARGGPRSRRQRRGGRKSLGGGENAREVPNLGRVPRNDVRGVARWSPGAARSTAREEATMTS